MELAQSKIKRLQTKIEMLMSQREPFKPVSSYELTSENMNQAKQIRGFSERRESETRSSRAKPEPIHTPIKSPFSLVGVSAEMQGHSLTLQSLAAAEHMRGIMAAPMSHRTMTSQEISRAQ